MSNKTFQNNLKKALADKNVTQIAKELDIPRTLLSDWMTTAKGPNMSSLHHVRKLGEYLGISFEQLVFGEESQQETLTTVTFNDGPRKYSITIKRL